MSETGDIVSDVKGWVDRLRDEEGIVCDVSIHYSESDDFTVLAGRVPAALWTVRISTLTLVGANAITERAADAHEAWDVAQEVWEAWRGDVGDDLVRVLAED